VHEQRDLACASPRASSSIGSSRTAATASTIRRVIESSTWSLSGAVQTSPSRTMKNEEVEHSSTRPCGVTSNASSAPCSRAIRDASMLAA
jgi:hypothetical protein